MTEKVEWPAWRYGPNGRAEIFQSAGEVPAGWQDHPTKVSGKDQAPAPAPAVKAPATPAPAAPAVKVATTETSTGGVDAGGWPFDPKIHAATQSRTKADLWRMKVGATRPAPKEGFPKPTLDL